MSEDKLDKLISRIENLVNIVEENTRTITSATEKLVEYQKKTDEEIRIMNAKQVNITEDIKTLNRKVIEVEKSQDHIDKQFDTHNRQQNTITKDYTVLQKEYSDLQIEVKSLKKKFHREATDRHKDEQYRQNNKIEIGGIPIKQYEDCQQTALQVAEIMGITISKADIDIAHRMANNSIIVVFNSRTARDLFWYNKRNLKGKTIENLGFTLNKDERGRKNPGYIFINEALTFYYKNIMYLTKEMCKSMEIPFKNIFTKKGHIKVKLPDDNNTVITIYSEEDLVKIK